MHLVADPIVDQAIYSIYKIKFFFPTKKMEQFAVFILNFQCPSKNKIEFPVKGWANKAIYILY